MSSHLRGHKVEWDEGKDSFVFSDTQEPTVLTHKGRPCGHCGLHGTLEGHDGCLRTLPGVRNACCGHGDMLDAYVQFEDGRRLSGNMAVDTMKKLKGRKP